MSSILVIEDDPAIRSAVQRAMTERGHALGYETVTVRDDLTGRARVLVARTG